MIRLTVALLVASFASGQDFDRVFRLTHTPAPQNQDEIATALKTVGKISTVSIDRAAATLTATGSADQIALAEWLVPRLDAPPPGPQNYAVAGNPNDLVAVYPITQFKTPVDVQETLTTLRTALDVRYVYAITPAKIIALRGTENVIAMAMFLLPKLDHAPQAKQNGAASHFHSDVSVRGADTLSTYGLSYCVGVRCTQEMITVLRTVLDLQKIYQVTAPAMLSMFASQSDIQTAEWLISTLDREKPPAGSTELKLPGGKDDLVHVFFLSKAKISGF